MSSGICQQTANEDAWATAYKTVAAGAAFAAGIGVIAYLKRSGT